jgi:hypothetical protein
MAALIVKNEERLLERCLRSMEGLVDEVVVVDRRYPGHRDTLRGTPRRIRLDRRLRGRTQHALDLARGEWILYIDADERVRPPVPASVRDKLADRAYGGLHVLLHPRPGFAAYPELRLFRNHPSIRFRGVMHERIWPDVKAYCARVGATVGVSHLVLDHEGYEGDQQHKHARNLPLLRKALREYPTRVFSWCHLASTHLALGRPRSAERAWKTALGIVRRKHQLQPDDSLPYVGLVQWTSASGGRAISLLDEALERFPRHAQLKWLQGRILMTDEKFESAIAVLEQLVDWGEEDLRSGDRLRYATLQRPRVRFARNVSFQAAPL